jgi:hypothetical protein
VFSNDLLVLRALRQGRALQRKTLHPYFRLLTGVVHLGLDIVP